MKKVISRSLILLFILATAVGAHAQTAKLSVQGILKKLDGNAVDNGTYTLRFRLYTQESGGSSIWEETQSDIEVSNGIYSAVLGSVQPLNVPFNQTYFLGVAVGTGAEMLPRAELTTAPYALSLIGQNNKFPSTGLVEVDRLKAVGAVYAQGGAPGSNNTNDNGFAFMGNNGDNDSGLFSLADGQASLFSNGVEQLTVSGGASGNPRVFIKTNATVENSLIINDQLTVQGNSTLNGDIFIASNKKLNYNGLADWRLVQVIDFTDGSNKQGWVATEELNNGTDKNTELVNYGDFNGWVLRPSQENDDILKRQIDVSGFGNYTYIKVRFKYYFTDSWDPGDDLAIAGFSSDKNGSTLAICWQDVSNTYSNSGRGHYTGDTDWSDAATVGEMIARKRDNNNFWVFVGAKLSEGASNESFALGYMEIWVK